MNDPLVEVLAALLDRDPDCEDRVGVGVIMRDLNRLSGWIDARKVRCARRLKQLETQGRSESASTALMDESRHSGKEAKAIEERERVCSQFPAIEEALAAGEVSSDHLDVLARLTKNLSDQDRSDLMARADEVVAAAGNWVSEFERQASNLIGDIRAANRPDSDVEQQEQLRAASHVKRWKDKASGLHMTLLGLDPLRDATLHNVIDAHLARLRQESGNDAIPFAALQAQAVFDAVTQGGSVGAAEIVIHSDAATVCHGRHADTLCETVDGVPVPVATMQRLCCEALLQAVIVNPDGTFDRLCAETRLASRQQRRALSTMYSTCAHPHCSVPFSQCRIHHIVFFELGGKTVLANLIALCERHHHQVHEGGWMLTMTEDRVTTWTRPDGGVWWSGQSINRRPAGCERSTPIGASPTPPGGSPDPPPDPALDGSSERRTERRTGPPGTRRPASWEQPTLI